MSETSVKLPDAITGVLDSHDYGSHSSENTNRNDLDINKSIASKLIGSRICPECKHTFTLRSNLKRHIKNKHPCLFPTVFPSVMPQILTEVLDFHDYGPQDSTNTNKDDMGTNKLIASKFIRSLICPECKRIFTKRSNLRRHIKCKHPCLFSSVMTIIRPHKCDICEKTFKSIKSLQSHRSAVHKQLTKTKLHKCPLCPQKFIRLHFNEHFEKSHNLFLKPTTLNFNSYSEFCEWKKAIERVTKSYFHKQNSTQGTNGIIHHIFICNRSGTFVSKVKQNKRKLKSQGSKKINAFCPAAMKAVVMKDGKCVLKFQSQHVGHDNELEHLTLTPDERKYVAYKLSNNSSLNDILNDIRNSALKDGAERLSRISRNDLYNIKLSLLNKDNQLQSFEIKQPDQKLLNGLRDIHNKHAESEDIRADITETVKGWLLTFIENNEICLIKENFKSCDCTLVCIYCRVCIKSYICSCSDSSVKGNMCKHIHFFCMERNKMLDIPSNDSIDCNSDEAEISSKQCDDLQASNHKFAPNELFDTGTPRITFVTSEKISTLKNKFCDLIDSLTNEEEYKLSESTFEELTTKLKSIQSDSADEDNANVPATNNLSNSVCDSDKKQDRQNSRSLKMTHVDEDNADILVSNNLSKSVCDNTKKQDQHNLHSSKLMHTPLLLQIPKPSGEVKLYAVSISLKQKANNV